jgi:hypothetical protein
MGQGVSLGWERVPVVFRGGSDAFCDGHGGIEGHKELDTACRCNSLVFLEWAAGSWRRRG